MPPPYDTFIAEGHWGQLVAVIPSLNIVAVRLEDTRDGSFFLPLHVCASHPNAPRTPGNRAQKYRERVLLVLVCVSRNPRSLSKLCSDQPVPGSVFRQFEDQNCPHPGVRKHLAASVDNSEIRFRIRWLPHSDEFSRAALKLADIDPLICQKIKRSQP
jgi:hypothetical protein